MRAFQHIHAWQRAHALAIAVHRLSRDFSRVGHAHLKSQLTRAADSVAANIAEGCGSATNKELARFFDISIKSSNEAEYHLLAARDLGLLSSEVWSRLSTETVEIRKMIYAYRKKILQSHQTPGRPRSS